MHSVKRVSLGNGSGGMRTSRCSRHDPAHCDRRGSIAPAQARPARPHRPALGRAPKRPGRCPASGRQPPGRVALAAALCRGGRRRSAARQVTSARDTTPFDRDGGRGAGADLLGAAGRCHPLDRPCRGPRCGDLVTCRAADLGRSPPPAASAAHVHVVHTAHPDCTIKIRKPPNENPICHRISILLADHIIRIDSCIHY